MSKPKKKSDGGFRLVDGVYKYLPIFLLLFGVANVYFTISFVRGQKEDYAEVRASVVANVSNAYSFVERSLSNEIFAVRRALSNEVRRVERLNSLRFAPVVADGVSVDGVGLGSAPSPVGRDRVSRVPSGSLVSARYFRVGGVPMLDFGSGFCIRVGEDFGYGVVEGIYPTGVICDGVFYRYERNLNAPVPVPQTTKMENVSNGVS